MLLDVPQTPDVLQEKLLHFVFVRVRSLCPNTRLHPLADCVKEPGAFHQLLGARSPARPDDSLSVDVVGKSFDVVHKKHFSVTDYRFQMASGGLVPARRDGDNSTPVPPFRPRRRSGGETCRRGRPSRYSSRVADRNMTQWIARHGFPFLCFPATLA